MLAKHSQIYPKEDELQAVQRIVSNTEKALKQVSDFLVDTMYVFYFTMLAYLLY